MPDLWPFRPLQSGISEQLQFFTSILRSKTGEQRIALRPVCRHRLTYSNIFDGEKYSWAKHFARDNGIANFYMPLWSDEVFVGAVADDATEIAMDTSFSDFRAGGLALVWDDWRNYVVLTIDTVAESMNSLSFTSVTGKAFKNARVVPVRTCYMPQGLQFNRTALFARVTIEAEVRETYGFESSDEEFFDDYPQYEGYNVVLAPHIESAQISESIVRSSQYVDNGFGPVTIEPLYTYEDFGQTITFFEHLGEELWERRRWIHWTRGKQRAFWLPSYNKDLQPVETIDSGTTKFNAKRLGDENTYAGHVMILDKEGNRFYRQITLADNDTVSVTGGQEVEVTISSSLGITLNPEDIALISYMSLVRFDSDDITIEYKVPGIATIMAPVTEVPE